MRLKRNRLNKYYLCTASQVKDSEGGTYVEYGAASPFLAESWPAGGKLQTEMYGARLPNIWNLRLPGRYTAETGNTSGKVSYSVTTREGSLTITPGDGICINTTDSPDYKIIAIYPYRFLTLEVERL